MKSLPLYICEMNTVPNPSMDRRSTAFFPSSLARMLSLTCLLQLFCVCGFYSPMVSLEVRLPDAPEHWRTAFPELDFRILFPVSDGGVFEERRTDRCDCVVLLLPKILNLPVLAYPSLPGRQIELPPAGGIYPLNCDFCAETITMNWQQGAAAEVLYRLWRQGVDCSSINVPRLTREISARCQGDPWTLDLDRICTRLATQTFSVTDIRPAPSRDLLLTPGSGRWFLESPFRSPVSAQTEGPLLLRAVPLGEHYLFESSPAEASPTARFFLYVDEETALMVRR
jgi:hypothetical protein